MTKSAFCYIEDFNLIKIKRELGFSVVALETVAESLGPSEECSTRVCTFDLHRTHPEHVCPPQFRDCLLTFKSSKIQDRKGWTKGGGREEEREATL